MTEKDGGDAFSVVIDGPDVEPSTKNEVSGPRLTAPGPPSASPAPLTVGGDGAMMLQSQVMMSGSAGLKNTTQVLAQPVQPRGGIGMLGRYTLLQRLGKGGMAEVFLATQDGPAGFQKHVVIKKSDPELAKNPRFVDMFLREAKIAALLNHTNVVQVFELGQEGETYFIAMEHIDGISLHKAARRAWSIGESIPMEVVVKCIADAARGLHYAHTWKDRAGNAQGFIHRDVSPDNLMVTRDGVTKVLDFGIAKMVVDDVDPVTKTGEIKGKIPYMSPEQLKGEALDGRADLWSLGVTLYWLLTGARPFAGGNDIATLQAILHETPLPPRQVNPLVPLPLERLTMRLLEKDRNRRFKTGAEVADALLTLLGPGAGSNAASLFALKMLALDDGDSGQMRTANPGSQSVQTVVAAKPQTEWLMNNNHVDTGENAEWLGTITGEKRAGDLSTPMPVASPAPVDVAPPGETRVLPTPSSGKGGVVGMMAAAGFVLIAAVAIVVLNKSGDDSKPILTTPPVTTTTPPVTTTTPPVTTTTPPVTTTTPPVTTTTPPVTTTTPPVTTTTTPVTTTTPPVTTTTPPVTTTTPPVTTDPPKPAGMKVTADAPDSIRWETVKGKSVGKGSASLLVPPDTAALVAVDGATGGRTTVAVSGGKADYNAVGKGRLAVRAQPYADVKLGGKNLGTTPFDPLPLVAGDYKVVLNYEGKLVEKTFTITAGKETTIAVNMLK